MSQMSRYQEIYFNSQLHKQHACYWFQVLVTSTSTRLSITLTPGNGKYWHTQILLVLVLIPVYGTSYFYLVIAMKYFYLAKVPGTMRLPWYLLHCLSSNLWPDDPDMPPLDRPVHLLIWIFWYLHILIFAHLHFWIFGHLDIWTPFYKLREGCKEKALLVDHVGVGDIQKSTKLFINHVFCWSVTEKGLKWPKIVPKN